MDGVGRSEVNMSQTKQELLEKKGRTNKLRRRAR
jgi:hypothetical protein